MVEGSDKTWSTGEGNGESSHEHMRREKDMTRKDELPRSVGGQYAAREHQRNNSRKNGEMEPKQKQHTATHTTPTTKQVVGVTGMEVKSNAIKNNTAQESGMLGP